jgi:hypothetical protein
MYIPVWVIIALAVWWAIYCSETYRIHLNDLGRPDAVPVPKSEYDRMREESLGKPRLAYP